MTTYLDTHALIWLAEGKLQKIGARAQALIQSHEVFASPMAILEMQLLYEIGRFRWSAARVAEQLVEAVGLQVSPLPFDQIMAAALRESWTRDPFDRLIVAQARVDGAPLITKDESIHANFAGAVW